MKKTFVFLITLIFVLLPFQNVKAQTPNGFAVIENWNTTRITVVWENPGIDLESVQGRLYFYDPQNNYYDIPLMYMGKFSCGNDCISYLWYGLPQDIRENFPYGIYHITKIGFYSQYGWYVDPTPQYKTVYCSIYFSSIFK